jgi:hypothetical protein
MRHLGGVLARVQWGVKSARLYPNVLGLFAGCPVGKLPPRDAQRDQGHT